MLIQLLLLLILLPLTDLVVLLMLASLTSTWLALGSVALSAVGGIYLARRYWSRLGLQAQARLARDELPQDLASNALYALLAAGLLIVPGILTDLLGLSLLIPACRRWYGRRILKWLQSHFKIEMLSVSETRAERDENVVDGEFRPSQKSNHRSPRLPD